MIQTSEMHKEKPNHVGKSQKQQTPGVDPQSLTEWFEGAPSEKISRFTIIKDLN